MKCARAVGQKIKAIKDQEPETWLDLVREHCGIGRSRAYEYISIAEGKKTAEEVAQATTARWDKHKDRPLANGQDDQLRKSLYECLGQQGQLTDEELQDRLKLSGSTERPRRVELWEAGYVEQCGSKPTTERNTTFSACGT